jgi:hypothetical protein
LCIWTLTFNHFRLKQCCILWLVGTWSHHSTYNYNTTSSYTMQRVIYKLYIFVVWLDGNLETQRRLKIPAGVWRIVSLFDNENSYCYIKDRQNKKSSWYKAPLINSATIIHFSDVTLLLAVQFFIKGKCTNTTWSHHSTYNYNTTSSYTMQRVIYKLYIFVVWLDGNLETQRRLYCSNSGLFFLNLILLFLCIWTLTFNHFRLEQCCILWLVGLKPLLGFSVFFEFPNFHLTTLQKIIIYIWLFALCKRTSCYNCMYCGVIMLYLYKVKVHIHKNKRIRLKKNNPLFEQ